MSRYRHLPAGGSPEEVLAAQVALLRRDLEDLRGTVLARAGAAPLAGARAYKSGSAQSIPNNTHTALSLNAETYDTDGYHDNATDNTQVKVPAGKGGKHLLIGSAEFAAAALGFRQVTFRLNGATFLTQNNEPADSANDQTLHVDDVLDLAAGDYVELMAFQNSGGALNANAGQYKTFLLAVRLGA